MSYALWVAGAAALGASLAGQSILQYAPTSPGAKSYRALAKEILSRHGVTGVEVKGVKTTAPRAKAGKA